MKPQFPYGFLNCFLPEQKVSCFLGAKSHQEFRKLLSKHLVSIGPHWFPAMKTVTTGGNQEFPWCFLHGFLFGGARCQ